MENDFEDEVETFVHEWDPQQQEDGDAPIWYVLAVVMMIALAVIYFRL